MSSCPSHHQLIVINLLAMRALQPIRLSVDRKRAEWSANPLLLMDAITLSYAGFKANLRAVGKHLYGLTWTTLPPLLPHHIQSTIWRYSLRLADFFSVFREQIFFGIHTQTQSPVALSSAALRIAEKSPFHLRPIRMAPDLSTIAAVFPLVPMSATMT